MWVVFAHFVLELIITKILPDGWRPLGPVVWGDLSGHYTAWNEYQQK